MILILNFPASVKINKVKNHTAWTDWPARWWCPLLHMILHKCDLSFKDHSRQLLLGLVKQSTVVFTQRLWCKLFNCFLTFVGGLAGTNCQPECTPITRKCFRHASLRAPLQWRKTWIGWSTCLDLLWGWLIQGSMCSTKNCTISKICFIPLIILLSQQVLFTRLIVWKSTTSCSAFLRSNDVCLAPEILWTNDLYL